MRVLLLGSTSWIVVGAAVWVMLSVGALMFLSAATKRSKHFDEHYDEYFAALRESQAATTSEEPRRSVAL